MAVLDSAEKSFAILNFVNRHFMIVWDAAGIAQLDSNQVLGVEREFALSSLSATASTDPDPGALYYGGGRPRRIRV